MLSAILVLLGLAGAIWYFARKQTHVPVTLPKEDVTINFGPTGSISPIPVVEEPTSPVIDPIFELPSEKVKAEIPIVSSPVDVIPAVVEAPVAEVNPIEELITSAPEVPNREFNALVDATEEEPIESPVTNSAEISNSGSEASITVVDESKPTKKKHYYYPKKK